MTPLTIGSLFSGVGGLDRGLEQSGLGRVVFQCEIDPFCRRVLRKHWPDATIYEDVRSVGHGAARVDVLCGGFPCQGLSTANVNGRGLDDDRSGLWREYARIVASIAPRVVVVENVGAAWREWLPVVRRDLWGLGYASVPLRVSPAQLGAPHHRDRIFVVAHADTNGEHVRAIHAKASSLLENPGRFGSAWRHPFARPVRLDDGLPRRMGEVRGYGNAVVPQCAELVGTAIVEALS